jgi:crotonobetainyl-CoA:carnitine CoA-transferase CaiB-like acyl-CoA transferase
LIDTIDGNDMPAQPPAFYDLQGGNTLAGAIATALFKRERTGESSIVDVSLLNVGMWSMGPDLVSAPYAEPMIPKRTSPGNPLTNWYRTSDGRTICLILLQADRFWGELCDVIGHPELRDDPRFKDIVVRYENREECVRVLDEIFASADLAEWRRRLANFSGVWAPVISVREVHQHPQVEPNGYLPELTDNDGVTFKIVASPMSFDDEPTVPGHAAPELGQDTELLLLESGMDWDQIAEIRDTGALG